MRKQGGTDTNLESQPCGTTANSLGGFFAYPAWPVLKNFSRMEFSRGNLLPEVSSKGCHLTLNSNPLKKRRNFSFWGFSVVYFPPANFFQNQKFHLMGGFKIAAMAPRSVAGEFLGGGVWSSVVWKNWATLRPSMEVFRVLPSQGKFWGKGKLPKIYDKNLENARDKKVFLGRRF